MSCPKHFLQKAFIVSLQIIKTFAWFILSETPGYIGLSSERNFQLCVRLFKTFSVFQADLGYQSSDNFRTIDLFGPAERSFKMGC